MGRAKATASKGSAPAAVAAATAPAQEETQRAGSKRKQVTTSTPKAQKARAVGAEPFKDTNELGIAWHSLSGFDPEQQTDEGNVEKLLKAQPLMLQRVLVTDESFFFGPAKVLLLAVAKRIGAAGGGGDGAVDGSADGSADGTLSQQCLEEVLERSNSSLKVVLEH